MVGTATITGKTGPGQLITAQALSNVSSVLFDIAAGIVKFNFTPAGGPPRSIDIDMSDLSTVTTTIVEATSLNVVVTNA